MTTPITTTADRLLELAAWAKDAGQDSIALRAENFTTLASAIKEIAAERDAANERAESLLGLCRNAQEMTALHAEMLAEAMKERDHWKANHADMVKRATILRDRPDCPLERVSAFEEVGKAFAERDALRQQLQDEALQSLADSSQAIEAHAEVERLRAERDALRQALADIADPISAWQRDLKEDERLEGMMAVRLARDPETYKRMARNALAASGKLLENGNG